MPINQHRDRKSGSPIERQREVARVGRIRAGGRKPEKGVGSKLKAWRFTSASRSHIEMLQQAYGGTISEWEERGQWELLSEASQISCVVSTRFSVNEEYSLYDGRIRTRLCDGLRCQLKTTDRSGSAVKVVDECEVDCVCAKGGKQCDLLTQIKVMLPATNDVSLWWVETKGVIANKEATGLMETLRDKGIAEAFCLLTLAQEQNSTGTNKWVVPRLSLDPAPPRFVQALMARTPGAQAAALGALALPSGSEDAQESSGPPAGNVDPKKTKIMAHLKARGMMAKDQAEKLAEFQKACKDKGREWPDVLIGAIEGGSADDWFNLDLYVARLEDALIDAQVVEEA